MAFARSRFQASMASVKLTEHAYWTPDPTFTSYLNYGAAISEVHTKDTLIQITTEALKMHLQSQFAELDLLLKANTFPSKICT